MSDLDGTRAVLLDALGTLIELEPPWVHLADALGAEPDERLVGSVRAEMAYYRQHSHEGRDADSLADLRRRCAAVLSRELGREISVETMMGAIRFRAFDDAAPALAELRTRGLKLVCVSNWDVSLPDVLVRCGLGGRLDGVVTSAEVGARKPDPAIFGPALEIARCSPAEAVYVGDTPEEDEAGARAAGIRPLIIDRDGGADIESLETIRHHLHQ
jgi:putative hydrolase of the HAD superfamily